jgi:hypothetical protein
MSLRPGLAAVEAGQADKFAGLLSDDMIFAGPVPQLIGKKAFVGLQMALVKAMPDWKFNSMDFKQAGDKVTAMLRITGT